MSVRNCYDCAHPRFYASLPASGACAAQEAFFRCRFHGCTSADEIGPDFDCEDWAPASDMVPAHIWEEEKHED